MPGTTRSASCGQDRIPIGGRQPCSDGAWHHVAVVFNENYVTFYKDGMAGCRGCADPGVRDVAGPVPDRGRGWRDARLQRRAVRRPGLEHRPHPGPDQLLPLRRASTGTEPGLQALFNLSGVNPALPVTLVNQVTNQHAGLAGNAAVIPTVLPQQPLPASVWTYQTPGESPAGPLLSPQGLLCTDNDTSGTGGAFLRSVELENGQVQWSYDVRQQSELTSVIIPAAVGSDGQTAYTGVQSPYKDTTLNFVEEIQRGERRRRHPGVATASPSRTRDWLHDPSRGAGWHFVCGSQRAERRGPGLGRPGREGGTMQVRFFADEEQQEGQPQFMTEPVADATSVYIGRNAATVIRAADALVRRSRPCSNGRSPGR